MPNWLNNENKNSKGEDLWTSSFQDEDGKPTTRVMQKGEHGILKGQPFPSGSEMDKLMEYDEATGETTLYRYISGDWRKL